MPSVYINEEESTKLEKLIKKMTTTNEKGEDNPPIHPIDVEVYRQVLVDILNKSNKKARRILR